MSEEIRRPAAAGDVEALAGTLARRGLPAGGFWGAEERPGTEFLLARDDALRIGLARALLRYGDAGEHVATLMEIVTRGLPFTAMPEVAEFLLERVEGETTCAASGLLVRLADHLLEVGRGLSPHLVAVIRRTSMTGWWTGDRLRELAASPGHPPVNPGEVWADRVLADLPGLGGRWGGLLVHASTARAARPGAAWERRAETLLEEIGREEARRRVTNWIGLAGRPRPLPLRGGHPEDFDSYNAVTLRGLIWMLAFSPPHPDTARLLGELVETALREIPGAGPRSPLIAGAAAYALSRMDGEAALSQLVRLRGRVTHTRTLKTLGAALDARAGTLTGGSAGDAGGLEVGVEVADLETATLDLADQDAEVP
ncbi:hypothetical protein GCM10010156_09190 [Planobispora rosea]|uniref:Uncharacterized protein n=1 Tax=Planobispora rosea TaxID=35762 RepID=A0A8J3RXM2_PLARO|nr:hypothetical protein GCM10010156_09190 [Planobispora rosea]GIH83084.1 hypothetical protein Pro02_14920 [Planobispora rosea]